MTTDLAIPPTSMAQHDGAPPWMPDDVSADQYERRITLTPASAIQPRPVRWLWKDRVALGTICMLAGRESVGKSTVAFTLGAQITRGELPGVYQGEPRAVIVAATEDSWSHTIIPRLMAAGADLNQVFRVDVTTMCDIDSEIVLPLDLPELETAVSRVGAAMILLDPLLSRLSAGLDTHKDGEVRRALEPLKAMAERTGASIIGIIHVNKAGGEDALNMIMGSRAFSAVPRSVLFAMRSPEDESLKLLGQPKNNLGREDLPTITYRIVGHHVTDTDEGEVWTSKVEWAGDSHVDIREALAASGDTHDVKTATKDATEWLSDYLSQCGGGAKSVDVKSAAKTVGHSERTLHRARKRLNVTAEATGFPRETYWHLPDATATEGAA